MAKKICKKKLTNSGGGVCFLTCLAAIFALLASTDNYLPGLLYSQFFSRQIYNMEFDLEIYFYRESSNFVMSVFALVMMFWAFSAAKYKRIGKEFGWLNILLPPALCSYPATRLYMMFATNNDFFDTYFKTKYDSDKFEGIVVIAREGLPILAGLLLIISGIIVLARIGGDDFSVEIPRAAKKSKAPAESTDTVSAPADNDPEGAFGFGENTQPVQGLTGETKPATYGENTGTETSYSSASAAAQDDNRLIRPSVKLCPKCGELVGDDELFCSNCGFRM